MADLGSVAITVGCAVGVNTVYDLQTGNPNVSVTLLAGGAVMGVLLVIGSVSNEWELVEAVAVLFLVGSLFVHGSKILGLNTALTKAKVGSGVLKPGAVPGVNTPLN